MTRMMLLLPQNVHVTPKAAATLKINRVHLKKLRHANALKLKEKEEPKKVIAKTKEETRAKMKKWTMNNLRMSMAKNCVLGWKKSVGLKG